MLAGVGPVRLVLFVVAANEGWRQQSEEHLAILDVLGVAGGVVALTKRDLVDEDALDLVEEEIRERLEGTALTDARVVRVSAETGEGLDDLRTALDELLASAPAPTEDASAVVRRPRVHDRRGGDGRHRYARRRIASPSVTRWSSTHAGRRPGSVRSRRTSGARTSRNR